MWDKVIELSEYESVRLKDIFSILQCALTRDEVEDFAQELLSTLGKESPLLEPYDYKIDA